MNSDSSLNELVDVLNQRNEEGRPAQFWLRDDDAITPSEPLDRLINVTAQHDVPLTLAVIPSLSGTELAQHLTNHHHVAVAVHGWSHQNHAPASEKKQELGAHRAQSEVVGELSTGFNHLMQLHTTRFVPVLVPPWNRIDSSLVPSLSSIGFQALSTFGSDDSAVIPMINTHVDIIDWKGTRGAHPSSTLVAQILSQLQISQQPLGLLTHHLVHDDNAWAFLENLLAVTSGHPGAQWVSVKQLLTQLSPYP